MYQLTSDIQVMRLSDGVIIPLPANESEGFAYEAWIADGNTPLPVTPKTAEQLEAEALGRFISALESHYDATAQARRYDNRLTCTLRAGYPGPFQAEGLAFATWMDECNAYAYEQMALVQAGERAQPTPDELLAELPAMVWP